MILAFDTAGPHCAVALAAVEGPVRRLVASRAEAMAKGQAERLFPMIEEVLEEGAAAWSDLAGLACGTGPGNFTGVRVAVSAARGLSLSLGVPAVGVTAFEPLRAETDARHVLASLPAPKGRALVQPFDGAAPGPARTIEVAAPPSDLQLPTDMRVIGHEAEAIARAYEARAVRPAVDPLSLADDPDLLAAYPAWRIACLALARLEAGAAPGRPTPLYVRAPDAAPPRHAPPAIVS